MSSGVWGNGGRAETGEPEIELGLLLWAMERGARPEAFGRPNAPPKPAQAVGVGN
jgi:hypothetical protein